MLNSRKNRPVVSMLRNRELNIGYSPYFTSLEIATQLIRSDKKSLYTNTWKKSSPKEIAYDSGNLYFSNYKQYCPVNLSSKKQPPPFYKMEKSLAKKRVSDAISYSATSVIKDVQDICQCETLRCMCLSPYLLSISEDNWLCQHSMASGKIMKQIYVNVIGQKVKFKYCDWDMYGERFILTTTRHHYPFRNTSQKNDVLANIAVFKTFPIEFYALMDVKRSVFGHNVTAVSISNQSLIIGLGSTYVAIYNFDDFLNQGKYPGGTKNRFYTTDGTTTVFRDEPWETPPKERTLTPYKLGDPYGNEGEIGTYPTGLPVNFTYSEAPPILFKVTCMGQIVRFGGYPYQYITIHPTRRSEFKITAVETDIPIDIDDVLEPGTLNDPVETIVFHPDQSNRIIFKKDCSIDVYKIIAGEGNGNSRISKLFSMGLLWKPSDSAISSFGRPIKPRKLISNVPPCCVLCSDYEDELEIFAVLAKFLDDDVAFVLLYDSVTGKELRSVKLKGDFCDSKMYQIYIDLYAIIIIERDLSSDYTVHVYLM